MLTLFSLALAAMLVSTSTACAGSWQLTYTASGSETTTPVDPGPSNFSDTNTGTNTVTSTKGFSSGFGIPSGAGTSMTITVTVTGTWNPDPNLPSDPAPPSVEVIETASIYQDGNNGDGTLASGSLDDGLSDPTTIVTGSNNKQEMLCTTPSTVPVQHLTTKSGSSFTLTHTLKASSTAAPYMHNAAVAHAQFVSYSASIHAQPYNWHIVSVTPGPAPTHGVVAGELEFIYAWLSTDGNIADLKSCYFHELVSYPGPNPFTVPAPFSWPNPLPNGVPLPGSGANGLAMTDLANGRDVQHIFTPVQPYFASTLSATQVFQFDDTSTGEANVTIPGTDNSDTILRSVSTLNGVPPWYYTVSKSNHNTTAQLTQ